MHRQIEKLITFIRDWRNQSRYFRWMMVKTKPFLPSLLLLFGCDLLLTGLSVSSAVLNKYIIDAATTRSEYGPLFAMLVGFTLLSISLSALVGVLSTYIHERYAFSIRAKVFEHILRSDWQKLSAYHSGDLMTRLTGDIDGVSDGIASLIPSFLSLVVRLVAAFCVLYYFNSVLAVTALFLGPLGVLLSLVFGGKLKKFQLQLRESESKYRSFLQETVANIVVVKTFEQEEYCQAQLAEIRAERLKLTLRRSKFSTLMGSSMRMVFSAGYLTAFGWGIVLLAKGQITYGTMTVFLSLVSQVQGPIMSLAQMIPQMISILASTGRIMELDGMRLEPRQGGDLRAVPSRAAVGIEMRHVSVAYEQDAILQDVNVRVEPGDVVGIVGYSGAGKTTLIRMLLALIRPLAGGTITFFGEDGWREDVSADTRRLISYVPQGNTLMSGTIFDNLTQGRAGATEAEMWKALDLACAGGFVRELPLGLKTPLKERAGGLSEGQAQRIAIARALIRRAPILILDEATSALDFDTEKEILSKLRGEGQLGTCLIITHRHSMLKYCTRALVIGEGHVAWDDPERLANEN